MAADPQRQEAPSNDLFGRWLAHHEQQSGDQGESTGSSERTPEQEATPRASRRLPSAAVASSAVERDPLIGSRISSPSSFGTRRPAANALERTGSTGQPEREQPPGWEPIVMRSVRSRAEKDEARKTPRQVERPGRLQRLKARLVDPAPEPVEETAADEAVPAAPEPPALPVRAPAPVPAAARSIEETIAASLHASAPPPSRHERAVEPVAEVAEPLAEPVVEPVVEPIVEPVAVVEAPEEVAAPRPVRAFIETPRIVEPEPFTFLPEAGAAAPEAREARVEQVAPQVQTVVRVPNAKHAAVVPEPPADLVALVDPVAPEPAAVEAPEPIAAEPEPVVARVTEIEPEPIAPQDLPEALAEALSAEERAEAPAARRSFLPRSLRQLREDRPESREPRGSALTARPGTGDAARDLVAEKARARAVVAPAAPLAAEPEPEPEPETETETETATLPALPPLPAPVAPEPEAAPEPRRASRHDEVATEMPGVYTFTPKRTVRRLLTIAMLMGLVGSAYFVRIAVEVKDTASIGLATIAVLTTAMLWAIRAGASVTQLEVHQGQLEVVQQGSRCIFDLASQYTIIEVHGEPGHRGWKVLFPRRGMAPFAVDASMVDPDDFMRVLRFFRPQLVDH